MKWTYVNTLDTKSWTFLCRLNSFILHLLRCFISKCTMNPLAIIPGFYILKECLAAFFKVLISVKIYFFFFHYCYDIDYSAFNFSCPYLYTSTGKQHCCCRIQRRTLAKMNEEILRLLLFHMLAYQHTRYKKGAAAVMQPLLFLSCFQE